MDRLLHTAIACFQYDDFLAQTLPHNLSFLNTVTVVTSPRDQPTIQLAKDLCVNLFITDALHVGGPNNKAHALNQWWQHMAINQPEAWLMTLDADILLFDAISTLSPLLDPRCLYGARRRMCSDETSLQAFLAREKPLQSFPLDTIPLIGGKLWGQVPQRNPAGLSGFLQLWCPARSSGLPHLPTTGSAEAYDTLFGLSFPEEARSFLPIQDTLHLGPTEVNWKGRRSPRWSHVPLPPSSASN